PDPRDQGRAPREHGALGRARHVRGTDVLRRGRDLLRQGSAARRRGEDPRAPLGRLAAAVPDHRGRAAWCPAPGEAPQGFVQGSWPDPAGSSPNLPLLPPEPSGLGRYLAVPMKVKKQSGPNEPVPAAM